MNKLGSLFLILCGSLYLFSCSKDEMKGDLALNSEFRTLNVIYKGVKYNVPCEFFNEKDSFAFFNEEFRDIYLNEISKLSNLAVFPFHDENGIEWIEYFDNEQHLLKDCGMQLLDETATEKIILETKAATTAGRVILWDDNGYHDTSITIDIPYDLNFSCVHLKPNYGFNDKCSALKVWNYIPNDYQIWVGNFLYTGHELRTVLISYEDDNYKGGVLYCVADNSNVHADTNLKNIPFKGSKTWNDRITSIKFLIAHRDTYQSHP